jgi:ribosomal protein S12 methylthiotransferase
MKIGMISLGCPKNLVDSEVMLGLAQNAGHQLTADAADADVLVVNTCAFIDKAKQESIDTILEMRAQEERPRARSSSWPGVSVSGIATSSRRRSRRSMRSSGRARCRDRERVRGASAYRPSSSAFVPLLSANGEPIGPNAEAGSPKGQARPEARSPKPEALPTYIYDSTTPRLLATPRHYAYVKIAEGCDYKCAFCIIPSCAGHYRSRSTNRFVREGEVARRARWSRSALISQDTTLLRLDRGRARRGSAAAARAESPSTASSGFGCSISIRRRSPTT